MTEPAVVASPTAEESRLAAALPARRRLALVAAVGLGCLGPVFFGVGAAGLVGGVWLAALALLTLKDLEERRIPNVIVLPTAALVLVAVAILHPDRLAEAVGAAVAAAAFLLLPGLIARGGVGMGDVKLAFLLGTALGRGIAAALLLGCLAAAIAGLVLIVRNGAAARKKTLPFAPFLTFGAVAALALGAPHVL